MFVLNIILEILKMIVIFFFFISLVLQLLVGLDMLVIIDNLLY